MEIVVDHLTRMAPGYICAAGLADDGRHIRPVLDGSRLPSSLLATREGPLEVGAIVDLGRPDDVGVRPEVEDHRIELSNLRRTGTEPPTSLWAKLEANAELSLQDIFGHDLENRGNGAVVPERAGTRSLGTLSPAYRPVIRTPDGRARIGIVDPDLGDLDLSITDVRFYNESNGAWIVDQTLVQKTKERLQSEDVLLSVGLGRPYPTDDPARDPAHWLQVNGIHFRPTPDTDRSLSLDDDDLLRRYESGAQLAEIADALNAPQEQVTERLQVLGLVD
ncbi:MAG: hypothetical protein GY926_12255 [bacterium]|nr:hypothetical protein [bacterium]